MSQLAVPTMKSLVDGLPEMLEAYLRGWGSEPKFADAVDESEAWALFSPHWHEYFKDKNLADVELEYQSWKTTGALRQSLNAENGEMQLHLDFSCLLTSREPQRIRREQNQRKPILINQRKPICHDWALRTPLS